MNLKQLTAAVEKLKSSSVFRRGDAASFDVVLLPHEVELPGSASADAYGKLLALKLGVSVPKGARVMVVCSGNGGLGAWALRQGAQHVLFVEPRFRYEQIVDQMLPLFRAAFDGCTVASFRNWPATKALEPLGKFDLILWPEGLEECQQPAQMMESLMAALSPEGALVVEVTHGNQTVTRERVNGFKPSIQSWGAMMRSLTGGDVASTAGRVGGRVLYRIDGGAKLGAVVSEPTAALPVFPRQSEPRKLYKSAPATPMNPHRIESESSLDGTPKPAPIEESASASSASLPPKPPTPPFEPPPAPPPAPAQTAEKPKKQGKQGKPVVSPIAVPPPAPPVPEQPQAESQ